jgi:hypothetical protein
MSIDGQRARTAILIPLVVFSAAAVIAIAIGLFLHLVPHGSAPLAALILVVIITAAGFVASGRADAA